MLAPPLDQVSQQLEDKRFAEYLEAEGYDISLLTSSDLTIRDTSDEEEIDSYSKKNEVHMKTISAQESV